MATTQYRLSGEDVDAVVLSGIEGYWALHDGVLAEKPGMAWDHQNVALELGYHLRLQLLKKSRPRLTREPRSASRSDRAAIQWLGHLRRS